MSGLGLAFHFGFLLWSSPCMAIYSCMAITYSMSPTDLCCFFFILPPWHRALLHPFISVQPQRIVQSYLPVSRCVSVFWL